MKQQDQQKESGDGLAKPYFCLSELNAGEMFLEDHAIWIKLPQKAKVVWEIEAMLVRTMLGSKINGMVVTNQSNGLGKIETFHCLKVVPRIDADFFVDEECVARTWMDSVGDN